LVKTGEFGCAAKVQFVNAATTSMGATRICFGLGSHADGSDAAVWPAPAFPHDDTHPMPGTTWPGIAVGASTTMPEVGDLLRQKSLTVFALEADKLKTDVSSSMTERTCDTLIGSAGQGGVLTPDIDFRRLGTFPVGLFGIGDSFVIAFFDCEPGDAGPIACRSSSPLAMAVVRLDTSVPDSAKNGVAVAHLSTPLWNPLSVGVDVSLALCGQPAPIATAVVFGQARPSISVQLSGLATTPCDVLTFDTRQLDAGVTFASNPHPLARIAALSDGLTFAPGANYTFVVLGDPSAPEATLPTGADNPQYDGRGVHVIVLANDPIVPRL
jgi:hypothetical protein